MFDLLVVTCSSQASADMDSVESCLTQVGFSELSVLKDLHSRISRHVPLIQKKIVLSGISSMLKLLSRCHGFRIFTFMSTEGFN